MLASEDSARAPVVAKGPAAVPATVTGGPVRSVFSSFAIPISGLSTKQRWKRVLADVKSADFQPCSEGSCSPAKTKLVKDIAAAKDQKFLAKLSTVNRSVNTVVSYRRDIDIHGRLDYWASPAETVARAQGDCEDVAILKMAALRASGIPTSSMSIVVLRDTMRQVFHAVLSVRTSHGNFILDNAKNLVVLDTDLPRYQALYSMSEDRSWVHGYRQEVAVTSGMSLEAIMPGEGPLSTPKPAATRNNLLQPGRT